MLYLDIPIQVRLVDGIRAQDKYRLTMTSFPDINSIYSDTKDPSYKTLTTVSESQIVDASIAVQNAVQGNFINNAKLSFKNTGSGISIVDGKKIPENVRINQVAVGKFDIILTAETPAFTAGNIHISQKID